MCRLLDLPTNRCLSLILILYVVCQSSAQGCGSDSDAVMEQKRKQTIRTNILAQLNLADTPDLNATRTIGDEESRTILAAYYALRNASESLEKDRERICRSQDFFAKPVTSFAAISPPTEETLNSSNSSRGRRDAVSSGVLNRYSIYFNFDLPENRTDISRADLLLYQLQSRTGSGYAVLDETQYVEVNAFAKSLGIQTTAEGKYVNVSDSGYQVFDITSTVKLWVSHNVKGPVSFEVIIHCYSSLTCNQKTSSGLQPTKVEFYTDNMQDKTPRLLTISNSVTENAVKHARRRRQASSSGVGYCQAQQSTCCLKPLTIRFREDLGFNFIVQPTSYVANYCGGVCPRTAGGDTMTPTLYEFLSQLNSGNPASSVVPCCAGNTYLPLEVLIQTQGQLVIEELQQVIVTSCRCT